MSEKNLEELCEPMQNLVKKAINAGYKIKFIEQLDFHFKDYKVNFNKSIKCNENFLKELSEIKIDKIKKIVYCECHWSFLECD